MSGLIKKQKALDAIEELIRVRLEKWVYADEQELRGLSAALCEIRSLRCEKSAVDVVRCKECIKRWTKECAMEYETEDGEYTWNEDQDFCSWGEGRQTDD